MCERLHLTRHFGHGGLEVFTNTILRRKDMSNPLREPDVAAHQSENGCETIYSHSTVKMIIREFKIAASHPVRGCPSMYTPKSD